MLPLSFDRTSFLSGDKRLFLVSGEIHYFRVPRADWRDRLQKMKDAGGNCIATYVPWLVHEPQEGRYTFEGQYDVGAFLDLCREVGIYALVRPGPYQYSELIYDGLPGWLCENYPELRARNLDGKTFRVSSISYMHPLFLQKARRWYEMVIPKLTPHQISRGGAVAAFQFDNELQGIHEWFGGWDYHPETLGIGKDRGYWPDYLQRKYGTVEKANESLGLTAMSFAEIMPVRERAGQVGRRRLMKDYQECYFAHIADYAATLVDWMRELGVDTPVVHNSAGPGMNAQFVEVCQKLGNDFLLGSDHYYNLTLTWPQNNPTPRYAVNCFTSLEFLRLQNRPATIFELPGGSLSQFPPVTPEDAACAYLANIALGMKGYNYYIFTGGPNPPECGTTSDIYDYDAAVSATGEIRPLYYVQQRLAHFLHANAWLAEASMLHDVRVGMDYELQRGWRYGNDPAGLLFPCGKAQDLMRDGLLMTSFCAGVSPTMVDLRSDTFVADQATPLVIVSWDCMDRTIQERLVRFLQQGGKLLLVGVVPTMDADFAPCTILADAIGPCIQTTSETGAPRLNAYGIENVFVTGSLFASAVRPDDSVVTAEQVRGKRFTVGWTRTLPGGGLVSVLGFAWLQGSRTHEGMLRAALTQLGWKQQVQGENPNIWAVVRSNGHKSLLFVMNLLSAPMETFVRYRDPATGQWRSTGRIKLPGITAQVYDGEKQLL